MTSDSALPTPPEVIAIHEEIEEIYDLTHTGTSASLPEQTLESILTDVAARNGTYERGAALLRRLISAHIFEDGNKRTAWAVTRLYLEGHGANPAVRDTERVTTVLRRIQRYDVGELAEWLATGEIDEERLNP